jgi:hypothetical protein
MSTLLMMWNGDAGTTELPETCPYSFAEIEEHIFGCLHEFLLVEEPRESFSVSGPSPCAEGLFGDRRYWLFEAMDCERQLQWFVIVGAGGKSLYNPPMRMKRWVYAESNDDGLSPEAFLARTHHEILENEARS